MSTTTAVIDKPKKKGSIWDGGNEPLKASYGKLMMWFFLLSDAFSFSALLITYGLIRFSHTAYNPEIHGAFKFSQEYHCPMRKAIPSPTVKIIAVFKLFRLSFLALK